MIKNDTEAKVLLAGIGTLLLQESLGDTVSQENVGTKRFTPMVIEGYKRLFNVSCEHYTVENRMGKGFIERGAANIEPAEGAKVNGIAFWVNHSELANLDKRERYYKRIEVPCTDFETGESLGNCHIYMSPLEAEWINRDLNGLLPLWRDIVYARVGAYRIGEAFGKMFDETTYMGDGETLMVDYYKDHLEALMDLKR
ncbi:gamma-glutamylcyclotransferase [bacterium]|nr:gamma-glutamylcyclotransferase [bacterium]